jgi:heterodisulfide reductase subunit A
VGVYVCHCGGNISDYVDVEQVVEAAGEMEGVAVARRNPFMCSDPGQDLIMEDLREGRVDRVVVASCSPSLHETTFRHALVRGGLNPYLYVHANIREQVSWVAKGQPATDKAVALVGAAVAKARLIDALDPIAVTTTGHATVIGGGVAGLKAAWDLALSGLQVALVEKSPFLGGNLARVETLFPTGQRADALLERLVSRVTGLPNLEVLTCAQVTAQEGYIGNFTLEVKQAPPGEDQAERLAAAREAGPGKAVFGAGVLPGPPPEAEAHRTLTTGAVVMATGFSSYEPARGELGWGHPRVVTLAGLIELLRQAPEGDRLALEGRPVRSLAMIHCVGSRQIEGVHEPGPDGKLHGHCSRTCCNGLLHAALTIGRQHPETVVYQLFRDIRSYGRGHEQMYQEASRQGVRFLRYAAHQMPRVEEAAEGDYPLTVTMRDILAFGEEMVMEVDLVVLGVGMLPGAIGRLAEVMKVQTGPQGFLQEVHPKIRPVEVATAGVFLAGTCQAPLDSGEAASAASAAAAKAMAVLGKDQVELTPFVASVDRKRCSACLTCARTCPFGVPSIKKGKAHIEPASCYGCGACAAECPAKAITLANFDDEQILAGEAALVAGAPGHQAGGPAEADAEARDAALQARAAEGGGGA